MKATFTVQQTARGLATSIARGDFSVALSRFAAIPSDRRAEVGAALESILRPDERTTWQRYVGRLKAAR